LDDKTGLKILTMRKYPSLFRQTVCGEEKKRFSNVFNQDDEQFNDEKAYLIKQVTIVIKLGVFLRRRCSERLILEPVL
jgi:hypothetical protein